jgi:hypothetical protein
MILQVFVLASIGASTLIESITVITKPRHTSQISGIKKATNQPKLESRRNTMFNYNILKDKYINSTVL